MALENNEAIRKQEAIDKVYQVMQQFDKQYEVNLMDDPRRTFIREVNKYC